MSDIEDPDALLAAMAKIAPTGLPIDIPITESARIALERVRLNFSPTSHGKKIVGAKVMRGLQKMLGLQLERHESERQMVCPGFGEACPTSATPPRHAFVKSVVASRGGGPWLCLPCGQKKQGAARRKHPILPCATCGQPSTSRSSLSATISGGRAFCKPHAGGIAERVAKKPCFVCGAPTYATSGSARERSFCDTHSPRKHSREPCAVCGQSTGFKESSGARIRGGKAYCPKHKGLFYGGDMLATCSCGERATARSAHSHMTRGTPARCEKHVKKRNGRAVR